MKAKANITGILSYRVYHSGKLVHSYRGKNLIVDSGFAGIASVISDPNSQKIIEKIAIGDSGTAPAAGDTAPLSNEFSKSFAAISYPANNQVNFKFSIGNGEANGLTIREFGLLFQDGSLFSRKLPTADIIKTASIAVDGDWLLEFNL